jgi:LysR family transcriptional regulator, hydrogen peroxide-inducible genes activator
MTTYKRLPTLTQLRHLIAVSEHLHFGKAAQACFITQSSLSISIKELENQLGATLVERTRRSVMMTPLGLEVVSRAKKIVTDVEDISDLVQAEGTPLTGTVRLGVIPTIAPFLLPRTLPALRQAYPGLKLYLREDRSAKLVEQLASGDLDLLILAFPYPTPGLETYLFAEDPFWVAFPRDHENCTAERISPPTLKNEHLLFLEEGNCLRDHALDACQLTTRSENVDFQASSLHTLVQMVDNGLGATLLPKMAIDGGIARSTKMLLRPLEGRGASRQIGLAWRATSSRKEDFKILAEFFRDELATPLPRAQRQPH